MAAVGLERPQERDAAALIVAAITAQRSGFAARDVLLERRGELEPYAVGVAACAIVDRLVGDVATVLAIDVPDTLANLGGWVAAHELEEGRP